MTPPADRIPTVVDARPELGGGAATPSRRLPSAPRPACRALRRRCGSAAGRSPGASGRTSWGSSTSPRTRSPATGSWRRGDPVAAAVDQARAMVDEGADLLDVGGESTRPGHATVDADDRDRPGRAGHRRDPRRPAGRCRSASTRRRPRWPRRRSTPGRTSSTTSGDGAARRARWPARRGARRPDRPDAQPGRAALHEPPGGGHRRPAGRDRPGPRAPASRGTRSSSTRVRVRQDADHNLALLRDLAALRVLGRPILLGTSRKSTLGKVLDLPADERLEATLATTALADRRRRRHRPRPRRPRERPGGPDGGRGRARRPASTDRSDAGRPR